MSAFSPNASWITTTPGHGPEDPEGAGEPTGTARYAGVAPLTPTVTSGTGSHLAPARDPGAVGHRVVPEQGRRLRPHQLADLVEHQPDLLFGPLVRPPLERVPERAAVRRPHHPSDHALAPD